MNDADLVFAPRQAIDGGVVDAPAGRPDLRFAYVKTTGSTNDLAMAALERGVAGAVAIVADLQTAGRGRRGSAWSTPAGEALLLSVGFRTALSAAALPLYSPAAAVATAEALDELARVDAAVKWPNDVFVADRKIAGILLESRALPPSNAVVVGIGLNLNQSAAWFERAALPAAVSLKAATGREWPRARVLEALLERLFARLAAIDAGAIAELQGAFAARDCLIGRIVEIRDGGRSHRGAVESIDLIEGITVAVEGERRRFHPAHTHILKVE